MLLSGSEMRRLISFSCLCGKYRADIRTNSLKSINNTVVFTWSYMLQRWNYKEPMSWRLGRDSLCHFPIFLGTTVHILRQIGRTYTKSNNDQICVLRCARWFESNRYTRTYTHTDWTIDNSWRKHPAKNRSVNPDWTLTCSLFQPAAQNQWLLNLAMWCAATRQSMFWAKKQTQKPPEILITSSFTWEHYLELDLFKFKLDYLNPSDPKICVTANKTIGTEEPGWYINIVPDELFQHIESRITISFPRCSLIQ